jgi:hypothetical protein
MDANLQEVLHRIASALEKQNELLENKERRQIKLDKLELESKKAIIQESKVNKSSQRLRKQM